MIKSDIVSESDLLFLIPNNIKKMHGLPLTRISGKRKRKQKEQKRKFILTFKCFEILENVIEETLNAKFSDDTFFTNFVDFKNFERDEVNEVHSN